MCDSLEMYLAWLRDGGCMIREQSGKIAPLRLNTPQQKLFDTMYRQAASGEPVRVIKLKPRKVGVSTFVESLFYFLARARRGWNSLTLAHTDIETRKIFGITRRVHLYSAFVPKLERGDYLTDKGLRFDDLDSEYTVRTGGGHYAASGDTLSAIHITELAKWQGTAEAVSDQMLSLLNSVPDDPHTIVVMESTANANDTSGEFEKRWQFAYAGHSGFQTCFSAWYEDERLVARVPSGGLEPTLEERELLDKYKLSEEQLAWRRQKIATTFNGDTVLFNQEFPHSPESAFAVRRGKIFPFLTRSKHEWNTNVSELKAAGYELYRGIDFGGNDPFVCIGIAHKAGMPRFTVDIDACPDAWKELLAYARDDKGKPKDRNTHVVDSLRYVAMTFDLTGHLHIYRLLYVPQHAHRGKSLVDLAGDINQLFAGDDILATVCDRSRPDSIVLLNQLGIPCCSNREPRTIRIGEIEDGISKLQALMLATTPIVAESSPVPFPRQMLEKERNGGWEFGQPLLTAETLCAMSEIRTADMLMAAGLDPIFGGPFG
mgnify:CR=1 FL=1